MSSLEYPHVFDALLVQGSQNVALLAPISEAADQARANTAEAAAELDQLERNLQDTAELAKKGLAQTTSAAASNDSALGAYDTAGTSEETHFRRAENLARRNQPGIADKQAAYGQVAAHLADTGAVRKAKSGTDHVSHEVAKMHRTIDELRQAQEDILADLRRLKKDRIIESRGVRAAIDLHNAAWSQLDRFNIAEGPAGEASPKSLADQLRDATDALRLTPEMLASIGLNLQTARMLHQQLGATLQEWATAPPEAWQRYNDLGRFLEAVDPPPEAQKVAGHLGALATTQANLRAVDASTQKIKSEEIADAQLLVASAPDHYQAYLRRRR